MHFHCFYLKSSPPFIKKLFSLSLHVFSVMVCEATRCQSSRPLQLFSGQSEWFLQSPGPQGFVSADPALLAHFPAPCRCSRRTRLTSPSPGSGQTWSRTVSRCRLPRAKRTFTWSCTWNTSIRKTRRISPAMRRIKRKMRQWVGQTWVFCAGNSFFFL